MPVKQPSNPRGKMTERESEGGDSNVCCQMHGRHNVFWGVVFVVVGFYWLAKSLGWLHEIDIPLFPLALVILGVYLILRSPNPRRPSKRDES